MRDVTVLLRVDENVADPVGVHRAVALIELGQRATVADDVTARGVLVGLGLTEEQAADQVRVSYGPLA